MAPAKQQRSATRFSSSPANVVAQAAQVLVSPAGRPPPGFRLEARSRGGLLTISPPRTPPAGRPSGDLDPGEARRPGNARRIGARVPSSRVVREQNRRRSGNEPFVRSEIQAAARLAHLALRTLDEGEPGEPNAQVVGLLLRLCIHPQVLHLFRGYFARSLASECDSMMRNVAAELWRTRPGSPQVVDLQVRLPLRNPVGGGLCLRPMEDHMV